jgi:hypothetical protein
LTDFRSKLKYQISSKSVLWEPICSIPTNEKTDITKLIVAFGNFANAPKNGRKEYARKIQFRWNNDTERGSKVKD